MSNFKIGNKVKIIEEHSYLTGKVGYVKDIEKMIHLKDFGQF